MANLCWEEYVFYADDEEGTRELKELHDLLRKVRSKKDYPGLSLIAKEIGLEPPMSDSRRELINRDPITYAIQQPTVKTVGL